MQIYSSIPNPSVNSAMDVVTDTTGKVCLDVILLLISGIPILVFKFGVEPFHRGFFCDDESIAHPYKDDTISTAVLGVVGLGLNVLAMLIGEFLIYRRSVNAADLESQIKREKKSYSFFHRTVHPYIAAVYISVGAFLIGCAICQSTTDLIKYSIGRLRPNFFAACQPDWSKINCTDARGLMVYVEDYVCTGDPKHIRESRLSHPSGHASMSFFCMLYLSFYLQTKLVWRGSKLLRHFLQFVLAYMAVYTCASRVSDYKHHWSDILGGAVLGTIVAVLTGYIFVYRREKLVTKLLHEDKGVNKQLTQPNETTSLLPNQSEAVYISDLCKRRRLYRVVEKLGELQKSLQGSYALSTPPGTSTSTVPNRDMPMEGRLSLQI